MDNVGGGIIASGPRKDWSAEWLVVRIFGALCGAVAVMLIWEQFLNPDPVDFSDTREMLSLLFGVPCLLIGLGAYLANKKRRGLKVGLLLMPLFVILATAANNDPYAGAYFLIFFGMPLGFLTILMSQISLIRSLLQDSKKTSGGLRIMSVGATSIYLLVFGVLAIYAAYRFLVQFFF